MIQKVVDKLFLVKKIVSKQGVVHFRRWRLLQTPLFAIYIHNVAKSDDDKHMHDHPWWFAALILKGGYIEQVWNKRDGETTHLRLPGALVCHKITDFHIIELLHGPSWSIVLTGPRTHSLWGYHTRNGWMDHITYRKMKNANVYIY